MLLLQHGFSEDNLKELLFAILQLLRESEEPVVRYTAVVDQILQEFDELQQSGLVEVDTEVCVQIVLEMSQH